MEKIKINTEYIKLDQLLKFIGMASTGGEAKVFIFEGLVKVNGEVTSQRGKKLRKDDVIEIEKTKYVII
ncbi:MAG: S4 domain protein YaaA [Clostridiales bacterium 38_11]|nr:MAG: S4 domain protein YaaA [Clostridiales bacterium 38_11]HBH12198.1 S4 domain-containing protein YaaA [Clostridiales bacterium]